MNKKNEDGRIPVSSLIIKKCFNYILVLIFTYQLAYVPKMASLVFRKKETPV